eukprot:Hpha_TRINITY_DN9654_c0_g1::TRINITY_DN9654_c0_g1_i1::g.184505::m.184505
MPVPKRRQVKPPTRRAGGGEDSDSGVDEEEIRAEAARRIARARESDDIRAEAARAAAAALAAAGRASPLPAAPPPAAPLSSSPSHPTPNIDWTVPSPPPEPVTPRQVLSPASATRLHGTPRRRPGPRRAATPP